ncbi:MAG: hypothetical protein QM808_00945 [Steroidobacteraceae bacterium]
MNQSSFKSTPTLSTGLGSEWVNGETRLIKDNNTQGSGEIFGFVWSDNSSNLYLITSADNGQTWTNVGSKSLSAYHVVAVTQDSTGKVHAISWATISDSGYYLRMNLTYTSGRISGFTLDTPSGIALPSHGRKGNELRADIKMVKDFNGNETLVYAVNMPTLSCSPVCDIKVYMGKAASLTPTSSSQLVNLSGTAGDTLVFDSCNYSACSTFGFSTHVHTALFAQNATSRDLYLFQGPIDGDYGLAYSTASFNTLYSTRLPSNSSGWSVGATTTISANVQNNVTPELMSVSSGTNYAWVMYVDPKNGVKFGRYDSSGVYDESSITSPDTTVNRNGWGVFSISTDDSKIWAIWDTLAPISGGSAVAYEGYWNGSSWTKYSDSGASDSMGMAGIAGWTNGTAAILFNGNVLAQSYKQPTAASIWTVQ